MHITWEFRWEERLWVKDRLERFLDSEVFIRPGLTDEERLVAVRAFVARAVELMVADANEAIAEGLVGHWAGELGVAPSQLLPPSVRYESYQGLRPEDWNGDGVDP